MAEYRRRHAIRGASSGKRGINLADMSSVDENLFTEVACAKPSYSYTRTFTGSGGGASDVDPISAPSSITAASRWDLDGFYGLNGYVELTTVASVDLELWCWDAENDKWFLVASVAGLSNREGFEFSAKVKNRVSFVRVSTSLAAGEVCVIYATGE